MYITLYASKDTQKDEKKKYAEAAKIMVRRLNEEVETLENIGEENATTENRDELVSGLKALIGASFIATGSRIVSSTMAAFLTRNHSRFQFSHRFAKLPLLSFCRNELDDLFIDSTEDGSPFWNSSMLNYVHRPANLEQVCLHDFASECHVKRKSKNMESSNWSLKHPFFCEKSKSREFLGAKVDALDVSRHKTFWREHNQLL